MARKIDGSVCTSGSLRVPPEDQEAAGGGADHDLLVLALRQMLMPDPKDRPSAGDLLKLLLGTNGIGNSSVAEIEALFVKECK